jgi:hypothetical protein
VPAAATLTHTSPWAGSKSVSRGGLFPPIGKIAPVSAGYGSVTIAGQSQQNTGDVVAEISSCTNTGAVTGNLSKAIASLVRT